LEELPSGLDSWPGLRDLLVELPTLRL